MKKIFDQKVHFNVRTKVSPKEDVVLYGIYAPVSKADIEATDIIKEINASGHVSDTVGEFTEEDLNNLSQLVYLASTKEEVESFCLNATISRFPGHFKNWATLHGYNTEELLNSREAKEDYIANNYDFVFSHSNDYIISPRAFSVNEVASAIRTFCGCVPKRNIIGGDDGDDLHEEDTFVQNVHSALFEVLHVLSIEELVDMKAKVDTVANKFDDMMKGEIEDEEEEEHRCHCGCCEKDEEKHK